MKVMPGVIGQIGQNVADNLFEIGQSAVKGTVGAVADIAHETVEQISVAPGAATQTNKPQAEMANDQQKEARKAEERRRFQEVEAELAQYVQRKQSLDKKVAEEKAAENQQAKQEDFVTKKKRDNWVNRIINRSQTSTEKGRMME